MLVTSATPLLSIRRRNCPKGKHDGGRVMRARAKIFTGRFKTSHRRATLFQVNNCADSPVHISRH